MMDHTHGDPGPTRASGNFLVFGAPQIREDEIAEVVDSLRTAWLGTGPKVARFQDDFRRYLGVPYAAAVSSCTAALHLSLLALGVGPGDEVITTPLTFCATVNAIIHCGATPVLADVDPCTQNIDPVAIAERITDRTRAVVVVHFAGRPCDMGAIMALAQEHGIAVVEDCAHAIEARLDGRQAGTIGDIGCFSFYATKNLTTGEGGMVVSSRQDLIDDVRVRALHGMSADAWARFSDGGYRHYQVVEAGFKYNMMDLQAAVGIHQLMRLEDNLLLREAVWRRYLDAFADQPLTLPAHPEPGTRHARHLFTVGVDPDVCGLTRDEFLVALTAEGIGVGVHYLSMPEQPYYRSVLGWCPDEWPNARDIGRRTVSLPLSAALTDEDVEDVITAVHRVLGRSSAPGRAGTRRRRLPATALLEPPGSA